MDDRQSIREFVEQGSESAFLALVNRHLGMVRATALRQTRDAQLADDVSQTVFILFSRKARRLSSRVVLSGWLYRTTCFVAQRALRAEQRRRRREQEAFEMRDSTSMDETYRRLSPMLDDAMSKLRETDRDAVLLRFIEQKPLREVGENLGLSEEAARKRVERSLDKLRGYFSRRGFAISASGLSAALNTHGAEQISAENVRAVASNACGHATGLVSAMPELAREALGAERVGQIGLIAASFAVVIVGGFLISTVAHSRQGSIAKVALNQQEALPSPTATPIGPTSTNISNDLGKTVQFRALDAETGQPIAGARILIAEWSQTHEIHSETNLLTDANGRCNVPVLYGGPQFLAVGVLKDGYEVRFAALGVNEEPPTSYTLKIRQGVTIGGVVRDENGNPVPGAAVHIQFNGSGDSTDREFQRERPGFPGDYPGVMTDSAGQWSFASASETNDAFVVGVVHPDFEEHDYNVAAGGLSWAALRAGKATLILSKGFSLIGRVVDEQRNPISKARVSFQPYFPNEGSILTSEDGAFKLEHLSAIPNYLNVSADGFAPYRIAMVLDSNTGPTTVELKPGNLLRLRFIDESGQPVQATQVSIQEWHGPNTLDWKASSSDGTLDWNSAPPDDIQLCAVANGFCFTRNINVTADGQEHTIALRHKFTISGTATEAASGKPIPDFKVIPDDDRSMLAHGSNGVYSLIISEDKAIKLHFEADGYETAVSTTFKPLTSNTCWNATLNQTDSRHHVYGVVLRPDGSPAGDVDVGLCVLGKFMPIGPAGIRNSSGVTMTKTSKNGQFSFPYVENPLGAVATCPNGFGRAVVTPNHMAVTIALKPWGRVTGQLKLAHESSANRHLGIESSLGRRQGDPSFDFSAQTDADGRFVIDPAPPVPCKLYLYPPGNLGTLRHETPLDIKPGAAVSVTIGGADIQFSGHLVAPEGASVKDWSRQVQFVMCQTRPEPPPIPNDLPQAKRREWLQAYWDSDTGIASDMALQSGAVDIHPDGSFTIEIAHPGTYDFTGIVASKPIDPSDGVGFASGMANPVGRITQAVTVPDNAAPGSTIDIGAVTVDPIQ